MLPSEVNMEEDTRQPAITSMNVCNTGECTKVAERQLRGLNAKPWCRACIIPVSISNTYNY